jgi:NitT/TauT family transport system substrate-binding protein
MNRRGVLVAAAAAALPRRALAQSNVLRISTAANDAGAEPFYARELGFFTAAGLDASVGLLANGGATLSGIVAGAIDIGTANVVSAVTAFKKGLPLRIVAGASMYDGSVPQLAILVPKTSALNAAKDLEGKTIATNPIRGVGDLATELWMQKRNADPATVRWIEMALAEMGPAMQQGRIDAATVSEPFIAANRTTTRIIGAPYSAMAPRFITIAFFANDSWARAHPDLVQKFADVMRQTARWANENPRRSGTILAASSKLDPQVVSEMGRVRYAEGVTPAEIQPNIDLAARYKLIDAAFPAQEMIYER